jgi:SAM-dependent methyltransferase
LNDRDELLEGVAGYYAQKLAEHGPTAAGVDWNSDRSQELRFAQLLQVIDEPGRVSINDYGCGYGALADFLRAAEVDADYHGFDVAPEMVAAARERSSDPGASFTTSVDELPVADYTVASGIFNVRLDADDETWLTHVLGTLDQMRAVSRRGFAFNMLTSHSDPERMRPDLFYADPGLILNHCIKRFSRRVAVLHDYELYEFTVLVRLGEAA